MSVRFRGRSVPILLLLLMAGLPSGVSASPFFVSNLRDSGRGSLRKAIEQANSYGGVNAVLFARGLTGTITLTSGPLTVFSNLNILGPGASRLTLSGGGSHQVFDVKRGTLQLSGFTVRDGQAVLGGGLLVEAGGAAQVSGCTFTGNTATDGGGIFASQSQLTVTGCSFTNNTAVHGGGINVDRTSTTLLGSTFAGNQAFYAGAGVFVIGAPATVDHCVFIGNQTADAALSLAYAPNGQSMVTNCLFAGNFNPGTGAILVFNDAHAAIVNCTVAGNTGGITTGSGIGVVSGIRGAATATIANSIVWGNTSFAGAVPEIVAVGNSSVDIKYSDVQGTLGMGITTDHLISVDPKFARDPNLTATPPDPGDLHLQSGSPGIDAGSNALLPAGSTLDLDGKPRVVGSSVDMGAYEAGAQTAAGVSARARAVVSGRVYDRESGTVRGNRALAPITRRRIPGPPQAVWTTLTPAVRVVNDVDVTGGVRHIAASSASFAVSNLKDSGRGSLRRAIQQANAAGGTNDIVFAQGLTGTISLTSGPLIVSANLNIQGPGASGLALSGGGAHRIFDVRAGTLQLSGLTVRDGQAVLGGGLLVEPGSAAQVTSCTFTNNTATEGGGIFAAKAQLTVTGCSFTNNLATDGGGIYPDSTALTLTNSVFTGNQAFYGGLGVFVFGTPATVDRCVFIGGQCADAALSFTHTPVGASAGRSVVTNCLLVGNVSGGAGAILVASLADADIVNCTVAGNIGGIVSGAGISVLSGISGPSATTVANSIVWGNISFVPPPFVPGQIVSFTIPVTVTNSDVQLGTADVSNGLQVFPGAGNLNTDPLFVRNPNLAATPPDTGDLHLQAGSPAINTGSNAALPAGITLDLGGKPRIVGGTVDMGAYEAGTNALSRFAAAYLPPAASGGRGSRLR